MTPPRLITLSEGRSSHIYLELFPCAVPILPICGSGIAVGLLPVSVSILAAVAAAILGDLAFTHQSVGSYSISIRILPSKPTPVVPFRKRHPQQVLSKTRRDKIQWFIKRIFHPTNFPPKNHFYVLQFFLMAVRPASTNAPTFLGVH